MTTRPYEAAALCWNTADVATYNQACNVISNDNVGYYNDYKYQCFGVNPQEFYDNLVGAGYSENICVCKFSSSTGTDPWTYVSTWGECNGACVSSSFTCDGGSPVAINDRALMEARDPSPANSTASSTVTSTSMPSQASGNAAVPVAGLSVTKATALFFVMVLFWGNFLM